MTLDELLASARRRLVRVHPDAAEAAARAGALLVDTRSEAQRRRDGAIPSALVIERNVLEWRLDPTSPWRVPEIRDRDQAVIVVCNQGYSSSLAAASLQDLGLRGATDLIGGFQAWRAAGKPVSRDEEGERGQNPASSDGSSGAGRGTPKP
jgi:rhodanese-related sulfurtransferase